MFRRFWKTTTVTKLGRWSRDQGRIKADLANHDHCGSDICRTVPKKQPRNDSYDSSMDVAVTALQSFHINPSKKSRKR